MLSKVINFTNDALYSYVLIILLVLGGIYFTVRTRGAQFRLLGQQFKAVTEKSDGKGVSSFQALMVSTASRVGTGNIIGVATALCIGGFGSVFWMWIIAIIGAASAFVDKQSHSLPPYLPLAPRKAPLKSPAAADGDSFHILR